MKKIIFLLMTIVLVFSNKIIYTKVYEYCCDEILDKDVSWIIEVEAKEEIIEEDIKDVFIGRMSGYGPDCVGCSGYLAYNGIYVGDGTIYYDDSEFGLIRIVAGDRSIPFGSVIEVNDSFKAIVLDRGGAIGFGKSFMFDLLYSSEEIANDNGILVDAKFEVLRYGF